MESAIRRRSHPVLSRRSTNCPSLDLPDERCGPRQRQPAPDFDDFSLDDLPAIDMPPAEPPAARPRVEAIETEALDLSELPDAAQKSGAGRA